MYSTEAFARHNESGKFEVITIERNECGVDDVEFDISFCGICHTDVHTVLNQSGMTQYPIVPGHEMAGKVSKVCNIDLQLSSIFSSPTLSVSVII